MKKIAIIFIALIATASVSFAAAYGPSNPGEARNGEEYTGTWTTYSTHPNQALVNASELPNGANLPGAVDNNGEWVDGPRWSSYSINNIPIDHSSIDEDVTLKEFLGQVKQLQQRTIAYSDETVAMN
jgi:surface antigen